MFFPGGPRETENPSLFSSLEKEPLGALSDAWSFAEALNHSARPGRPWVHYGSKIRVDWE